MRENEDKGIGGQNIRKFCRCHKYTAPEGKGRRQGVAMRRRLEKERERGLAVPVSRGVFPSEKIGVGTVSQGVYIFVFDIRSSLHLH